MLLAAALVLELCRESLTGTHCRYREYQGGVPTENYRTDRTNRSYESYSSYPSYPSSFWLNSRLLRRTIVYEHPLQPWAYDYDATGALVRRTPLFFRAKPARVFDPNPVVALNDPTLQDLNDSATAVPASAYKDVELTDAALHGPHVNLVDRQPRNVAPPEGELLFDREQDGFEDVSAYFHIDRNQRHLQSLGYTGTRAVVPYAIDVDAHAASGSDNSFFIPSSTEAGKGTLFFGEGGTDDAEDADLLVHEYAHAIHEWIAPGSFGGAFASESRAIAEGFGDYWAYSAHAAARRASGRDPYCFADWDARCWEDAASESCGYAPGTDCLRRLDSTKTMADYDSSETSGVEHRNGAIWSSALRDLHEKLGRTITDTLVIESLFGVPPRPTFAIMAERMLQADRLLYQGAHIGAICSAMFPRGIVTQCDTTPRGERTIFQSSTYGVAIPENSSVGVTSTLTIDDPRAIAKIYVRVDVEHTARGDLFVELTAPNGAKFLLHQLSSSRTADLHATFGLDAVPAQSLDSLIGQSAAGTWTLFVADRRPRDTGRLQSWGLEIQFEGDEPRTTRPSVTFSRIPVVAHVIGESGTHISDVRITNRLNRSQTGSIVFTRSGENGRASFAMQQFHLAAGQTIAFDDVVHRTFHTFGSGAVEIFGEVAFMSRMYIETANGTLGQAIPPRMDTTKLDQPPLLVAPFADDESRYNFGISEVSGGIGMVRITGEGWERHVPVTRYSHVQFPVPAGLTEARVITGNAEISAYVSQITAGDPMFIAAERTEKERQRCIPAITSQTSGVPEWRSDVWFASRENHTVQVRAILDGAVDIAIPAAYEDVLARLFHRTVTTAVLCTTLPPDVFASSRIVHGSTTQGVQMPGGFSIPEGHLLFIDNDATYRTNIGVVSQSATIVTIIIYDAAGIEIERRRVVANGLLKQFGVISTVTNGHAVVIREHGSGTVYASLIDRRTGDATFFPAW